MSIIIENMIIPNSCKECIFLHNDKYYPSCLITNLVCGRTFLDTNRRMDKCPLKEVKNSYLTLEEIKNLPEGTFCNVIYTGHGWDEKFGKVFPSIKIGENLYHYTGYDNINDNHFEDLDFEVFV